MKKNNIFIWGWYGFDNFGDDLLQQIVFEKLKSDKTNLVFSMKRFYSNVHFQQVQHSFFHLFFQSFKCDALIFGPGGLFPFKNTRKLLLVYLSVLVWKAMRKKVLFWGAGISDDISWFDKVLWRRIVSLSDLFLTRSDHFFSALNIVEDHKKRTIADCVFSKTDLFRNNDLIDNQKIIGIAIANIWGDTNPSDYHNAVNIFIDVCKTLLDRGYCIDLIAFTKGRDDIMADTIKQGLLIHYESDRIRVIHLQEINQALDRWKSYEQVICMRFHAFVLSILANVPALPIAYGKKTSNLAEACGLSDYIIYWNTATALYFGGQKDTDAWNIIAKFNQIQENKSTILRQMETTRKEMEESASASILLVREEIGKVL